MPGVYEFQLTGDDDEGRPKNKLRLSICLAQTFLRSSRLMIRRRTECAALCKERKVGGGVSVWDLIEAIYCWSTHLTCNNKY